MVRLARKKVRSDELSPHEGYLDTERGFGYRFIPKCGSTSVLRALREERIKRISCEREKERHLKLFVHRWAKQHRGPLEQVSCRYLVVRDPVERFLSAFSNKILDKNILVKLLNKNPEAPFIKRMERFQIDSRPDLNTFINRLELYLENEQLAHHVKPISEHLRGVRLDFFTEIFKFSELDQLAARLSMHLSGDFSLEHHQKSSAYRKARLFDLSPSSFEKLLDFYSEDYRYLESFYPIGDIKEAWVKSKTV